MRRFPLNNQNMDKHFKILKAALVSLFGFEEALREDESFPSEYGQHFKMLDFGKDFFPENWQHYISLVIPRSLGSTKIRVHSNIT